MTSPTITPPPGAVEVGGSQAPMYKWEKVGQSLVGRFIEVKPFRNGHLAKLVTDEGEICTFSAPTILADRLNVLAKGDRIMVGFVSEKASGKASPIKEFKVWKL